MATSIQGSNMSEHSPASVPSGVPQPQPPQPHLEHHTGNSLSGLPPRVTGVSPSASTSHTAQAVSNEPVTMGTAAERRKSSSTVNFNAAAAPLDDDRRKYLTAKYGQHQMQLIRKRLAVEDWLDKQLKALFDIVEPDTYDCEIDLDDLLDMEEEAHRRHYVLSQIRENKKSPDVVNKFIEDLMEKANTL